MRTLTAALIAIATWSSTSHGQTIDLRVDDGGFSAQNHWQWSADIGWWNPGSDSWLVQRLLTPTFTATGTSWGMSIIHSNAFEPGGFDGGKAFVSINGGAFADVGSEGDPYTCLLSNDFFYPNPYAGQPGFCGTNASRTSSYSGVANVGDTYRFAFDLASDASNNEPGYDWIISSFESRNLSISTVPEPSTYLLMAAGLASLGVLARRRKRKL